MLKLKSSYYKRDSLALKEGALIFPIALAGFIAGGVLAVFISPLFGVWSLAAQIVIPQFTMLGACVLYCHFRYINIVDSLRVKTLSGKQIVLLPVVTLATVFAFAPIAQLFVWILTELGYNSTGLPLDEDMPGMVYLVIFALIVVLPAIVEEAVFRGYILSGLKKKGATFALLMSSLLFMLMHGSPTQTVHQFMLALVMGYTVIVSDSLLAGSIVHLANNSFGVMAISILTMLNGGWIIWVIVFVFGIILLPGLLFVFTKLSEEKKSPVPFVLGWMPVTQQGGAPYSIGEKPIDWFDSIATFYKGLFKSLTFKGIKAALKSFDDKYTPNAQARKARLPALLFVAIGVAMLLWVLELLI